MPNRRSHRPVWRHLGQGGVALSVVSSVVLALGASSPIPPTGGSASETTVVASTGGTGSRRLGVVGSAAEDRATEEGFLSAVAETAEELAIVIGGAIEEATGAPPGEPPASPTSPTGGLGSDPGARRTEAIPLPGSSGTDAVPLVVVVQGADGSLGVERREIDDAADVHDVATELAEGDGTVVAVGVDEFVGVDDPLEAVGVATVQATDAYRGLQWALDRVPFEESWAESRGSAVTVAVIDTAVDAGHPDLAGQVLPGYHFLQQGSGPGFAAARPGNFHGTHVAGIVAALAGNGIGIAGGAPDTKILPIEVLGPNGAGRFSDIVSGIIYAVDHGARVINLSLGGDTPFAPFDAAVAYAESHDVVVLAAAGNGRCSVGVDPSCASVYPAASPYVVAVGSVDSDLECSSFTTRAPYVALGAPGGMILSTSSDPTTAPGGYVFASGTSMATPYASAAAAIVLGAHPELSAAAVRNALISTAVDVAEPGPDTCTGEGLIDPLAALDALAGGGSPAPPATPPTSVAPSLGPARFAGVLGARGMVRLSFVAPPGAVLLMIYRDGQLIASVDAVRRSYTDRDVAPRTTYTYEVVAWSPALGTASPSTTRKATTRG